MQNRTYDDGREQELIMSVSEFEQSVCKAKEEGYQEAVKWRKKYESLKKAVQSISELCE